jgi:WD40 repeat protein
MDERREEKKMNQQKMKKSNKRPLDMLHQCRVTGKLKQSELIYQQLALRGLVHTSDLRGHYGCVNSVSFSRGDQALLCTGSDDKRVLVWNMLKEKKHLRELNGHHSNIFCAIFDSDNQHIISGGNDQMICYFDLERASSAPRDTLEYHSGAVYNVSLCPSNDNVFLSASEDKMVCLWDIRDTKKPAGTISSVGAFISVDWNPNDRLFVTANSRESVQYVSLTYSLLLTLLLSFNHFFIQFIPSSTNHNY